MTLKIPPAFVAVTIAGLMHVVSVYLPFGSLTLFGAYWLAGLLIVTGGMLGVVSLFQFYRNNTSIDPHQPSKVSTLVTDGIYQYTRNPMYLALFFLLIGYASILQNVLNLFILPLFIWYMNRYQIIPEEEVMEEKFGSKYLKYKSEVHRWL